MAATSRRPGKVVRDEGNVEKALAGAAKMVEADFYVPHYAHSTMEPPSAVALVKDGKCEVWSSCQDPQAARSTVAGAIGMDEKNVTSRVALLGGAFGRKSKPDFAAEAAILSRQLGVPVKVTWSREDDLQHAYYHTPTALHVKAGLDKNGKVVAWHSNSVFPTIWSTFEKEDPQLGHPIELSLGYLDVPYNVPNLRLENGKAKAHVRIGWLRSVNNIPNAFAQNTMANMLAQAAGRDPYEFLLELIGPDRVLDLSKTAYWNYDQTYDEYPIMTSRLKGVLRTAAEQAGYGKKKLGPREAIGVAVHRSFTTYVGTAVHVKVAADGSVTIPRVDVARRCRTRDQPRAGDLADGRGVHLRPDRLLRADHGQGRGHRAAQLRRVHGGTHAAGAEGDPACTWSTAARSIRREAWASRARRRSRRRWPTRSSRRPASASPSCQSIRRSWPVEQPALRGRQSGRRPSGRRFFLIRDEAQPASGRWTKCRHSGAARQGRTRKTRRRSVSRNGHPGTWRSGFLDSGFRYAAPE